jgi:hypothetical protein
VQPLAPGVERLMDWAVIAPVVLALPRAIAHLPTAKSDEDADWRTV